MAWPKGNKAIKEKEASTGLDFKNKVVGTWVMELKGVDDGCWELKSEQSG